MTTLIALVVFGLFMFLLIWLLGLGLAMLPPPPETPGWLPRVVIGIVAIAGIVVLVTGGVPWLHGHWWLRLGRQ